MTDKVDSTMKVFYAPYNEENVKPSPAPSPPPSRRGQEHQGDLYIAVDSVASGKKSLADWQNALNDTSNALNAAAGK